MAATATISELSALRTPDTLIEDNVQVMFMTLDNYYRHSGIQENAWSKLLRSVEVLLLSLEGEDVERMFSAKHNRGIIFQRYKSLASSLQWFSEGEDYCVTRCLQQVIQDIVGKFGPDNPMPVYEFRCLSNILDLIFDYSDESQLIEFFRECEMDVGESVEKTDRQTV